MAETQWTAYRDTLCRHVSDGHVGLEATGTCSQCVATTACCNQRLCEGCAHELRVCPFCGLKRDWTGDDTAPSRERPLLAAMLGESDEISVRRTAVVALTQLGTAEDLTLIITHGQADPGLADLVAAAIGELGEQGHEVHLERALSGAATRHLETTDPQHDGVARAVAKAWGRLANRVGVEGLVRVASSEGPAAPYAFEALVVGHCEPGHHAAAKLIFDRLTVPLGDDPRLQRLARLALDGLRLLPRELAMATCAELLNDPRARVYQRRVQKAYDGQAKA